MRLSMRVPPPNKGHGNTHVHKDGCPILLPTLSRASAGQASTMATQASSLKAMRSLLRHDWQPGFAWLVDGTYAKSFWKLFARHILEAEMR